MCNERDAHPSSAGAASDCSDCRGSSTYRPEGVLQPRPRPRRPGQAPARPRVAPPALYGLRKDTCVRTFPYRRPMFSVYSPQTLLLAVLSVSHKYWQFCENQEPALPVGSAHGQCTLSSGWYLGGPRSGVTVICVYCGQGSVHLYSLLVRLHDGGLPTFTGALGGWVSAGGR